MAAGRPPRRELGQEANAGGGRGAAAGREWAAASARTLARRLRRQKRDEVGETRAAALQRRSQLARVALLAHWRVTDRLGAHLPTLRESAAAMALLGSPVDQETRDLIAQSAWAKHAAPPGFKQAKPMPRGLPAVSLEDFRASLWQAKGHAPGIWLDRQGPHLGGPQAHGAPPSVPEPDRPRSAQAAEQKRGEGWNPALARIMQRLLEGDPSDSEPCSSARAEEVGEQDGDRRSHDEVQPQAGGPAAGDEVPHDAAGDEPPPPS